MPALTIEPTAIPAVRVVTPVRHGDSRGFFSETWNRRDFAALGLDADFVQDNHSRSTIPGTIRGCHFQTAPAVQAKLVRVIRGRILDVAVDIRVGSPTYGQHVAVELDADTGRQLYIPVGFGHGFCTLEPDTEVLYKVTGYYARASDLGFAWDDPTAAIAWPDVANPDTLSAKDRAQPRLDALPVWFRYDESQPDQVRAMPPDNAQD